MSNLPYEVTIDKVSPGISSVGWRKRFEKAVQGEVDKAICMQIDGINRKFLPWTRGMKLQLKIPVEIPEQIVDSDWRCDFCNGVHPMTLCICPGCQAPRGD